MRVAIARSAQKEIERLSDDVLPRIRERILALGDNPFPKDSRKLQAFGDYRLRVGEYRVIYEVDAGAGLVTITRVRHRREVYRWKS